MKEFKDFIIKFKGLANGQHEFDFLLTKPFFEKLSEDGLQDGRLNIKVILSKEDDLLTFDFIFDGTLNVMCDRCLDYFDMPFRCNEKLYVKFGKERQDEDENLISLPEEEFQIDLFDYLMQYVIIHLPMQRIHPQDGNGNSLCNKEMLKRIEELSKKEEEKTEQTDPRWDVLKNFVENKD